MPEPDWMTELRSQLDALSGSHPVLHHLGPLRAVVVSLVEVHRNEAYKRGVMAGRSQARTPHPVPLAGRHLEVARLAAAGLTNKEIGQRLFLSENTVKTHLRSAFKRTGARSRGHLAALLAVSGQVTSVNVPNPEENRACPGARSAETLSPASSTAAADET